MKPASPVGSSPSEVATRHVDLDILRAVAVAGVIAIHVFGGIVSNDELRGQPRWWVAVALDLGSIWVVPVFVMVSGALLLDRRMHAGGPAAFYKKRLLRLGPAFVFWQLFYIFVVRMILSGQDLSVGQIVGLFADGRTYTHLYFLWLIVGLYAIAPVLAAFLHAGGDRRALIFAAVVLTVTAFAGIVSSVSGIAGYPRPIVLSAFTQWVPYVGYFLAGWALREVILRGKKIVLVTVATAALIAEIVIQYGIAPALPVLQGLAPVGYFGPIVMLASIGVFLTCRGTLGPMRFGPRAARVIREFSDASFGVYLVHFSVIVLAVVLFPGVREALSSSLWVATMLFLVVLVTSFAIAIVARRVPYLRRLF